MTRNQAVRFLVDNYGLDMDTAEPLVDLWKDAGHDVKHVPSVRALIESLDAQRVTS